MQRATDWSGLKFKLSQELGDNMDIFFIDYDRSAKSYEVFQSNHQYHDGAAFLNLVLEKKNLPLIWPTLKSKKKPLFIEQVFLLFKFVKKSLPNKIKWKKFHNETGACESMSFASFSKLDTDRIKNFCKKWDVSLTALLFWSLDRTSRLFFLEQDSERKWVCPINMRSKFTEIETYQNCSSSIIMNFSGDKSLKDVQRQLKASLKSKEYWGGWLYTRMAKFLGVKFTKKFISKKKYIGTGVMSNMGEINTSGSDEKALIPVPPASKLLPISCASFTHNGRLGLSSQIHPALGSNPRKDKMFLEVWVDVMKEITYLKFEDVHIHNFRPKEILNKSYLFHPSVDQAHSEVHQS